MDDAYILIYEKKLSGLQDLLRYRSGSPDLEAARHNRRGR